MNNFNRKVSPFQPHELKAVPHSRASPFAKAVHKFHSEPAGGSLSGRHPGDYCAALKNPVKLARAEAELTGAFPRVSRALESATRGRVIEALHRARHAFIGYGREQKNAILDHKTKSQESAWTGAEQLENIRLLIRETRNFFLSASGDEVSLFLISLNHPYEIAADLATFNLSGKRGTIELIKKLALGQSRLMAEALLKDK